MKSVALFHFTNGRGAQRRLLFVHLAFVFVWLLVFLACVATAANAEDDPTTEKKKKAIKFSGVTWEIKDSAPKRVGPGPNYFSDRNASVDEKGRLHLKITREKGEDGRTRWYCAEVICKTNFGGYGTYRWFIDSPVQADPNIVLGLFTWDNTSSEEHHREIDIELISTWGEADSERNAQYVVQPWDVAGRRKRWEIAVTNGPATSTHAFIWRTGAVEFLSLPGHNKAPSEQTAKLQSWTFRGREIPTPAKEQVRMNLWLMKRLADDAPEPEVIINKFEFEPVANESLAEPVIVLSEVPDSSLKPGPSGTGPIAGKVSGVAPDACKVVVYALGGDVWFVQPLAITPDTKIKVGKWSTTTHGGTEYAAILVKSAYKARPTLAVLPEVEGDVLAIARKKPE